MEHRSLREIENHRTAGAERLARLADFLDTVDDGRLTFSRWYGDGKGCAVALAAAEEPWFQAQGLALLRARREGAAPPVRPHRVRRRNTAAAQRRCGQNPRHLAAAEAEAA